jgi:sulfonate transport system ATP-binding protein
LAQHPGTSRPAVTVAEAVSTKRTTSIDPSRGAFTSIQGLSRRFGDREVLKDVNLTIQAGEIVALLGASGSGKSTLLRALAGLDAEATGYISLPRRRSVVFQDARLLPWQRVWRNVVMGLTPQRARAIDALREVGLDARADAWPRTLSGGEAQRAALARALVREPDLLLMDEPFGALDALTRIRAQDLLLELYRRHHPAVLLVTHDVDEALRLADRAVVLVNGRIAAHIDIELERPRRHDDPRVHPLRAQLLSLLGVEH